jgi:hypothetical protein
MQGVFHFSNTLYYRTLLQAVLCLLPMDPDPAPDPAIFFLLHFEGTLT